uniref:Uncharacterized protein n=1 Tax=Anguilla anguilla TaxID=7936 RepID=A0A0E9UBT6_ANGAN
MHIKVKSTNTRESVNSLANGNVRFVYGGYLAVGEGDSPLHT